MYPFPGPVVPGPGEGPLGLVLVLGVAPVARQARSTNYVANGAVGQDDREGSGSVGTSLVARETIKSHQGLGVPQVNPS